MRTIEYYKKHRDELDDDMRRAADITLEQLEIVRLYGIDKYIMQSELAEAKSLANEMSQRNEHQFEIIKLLRAKVDLLERRGFPGPADRK